MRTRKKVFNTTTMQFDIQTSGKLKGLTVPYKKDENGEITTELDEEKILKNRNDKQYFLCQVEVDIQPGVTKVVTGQINLANYALAAAQGNPMKIDNEYLVTIVQGGKNDAGEELGALFVVSHLLQGERVANEELDFNPGDAKEMADTIRTAMEETGQFTDEEINQAIEDALSAAGLEVPVEEEAPRE